MWLNTLKESEAFVLFIIEEEAKKFYIPFAKAMPNQVGLMFHRGYHF